MCFRKLLLLYIIATICNCIELHAQTAIPKTHRILILLDGSHYMSQFDNNDKNYFNRAAQFITHLIDSSYVINNDLEYGLRVYGHQYYENDNKCNDSRLEVRFTKDNLAQISLRLRDLKPKGNGNPFYAIQQAYKNEMVDTQRYWYSIVWITADTGKCNSDPCTYIRQIMKTDLYKLFNVQLKKTTANTTNCFEPIYITNEKDEVHALTSIIPYYKKNKTPEAYWDVINRKKPKEIYILPDKQAATTPIVKQKKDAIVTLSLKVAYNIPVAKKEVVPIISKANTPTFIPPVHQSSKDSVTLLSSMKTRTVELKKNSTRVKAGTIAVPIFRVPLLEQRDSVVSLTSAATKNTSLSITPTTINASRVVAPLYVPPTYAQARDSVAIINPASPRNVTLYSEPIKPIIKKIEIPFFIPPVLTQKSDSITHLNALSIKNASSSGKTDIITPNKIKIPSFIPATLVESRDSVAALYSLVTKTQIPKHTATFVPKVVAIPVFSMPKQPDKILGIAAKPLPISVPPLPKPKVFRTVQVPEFYAIPLLSTPKDNQTEMPQEQPIEEVVGAEAIPAIVFGNLNIKSFGATVRVQVYRIKLGEDVLVSDNSFSGPKQISIKLETGRYKLRYNLNDGTEITKPFLIDEQTDTDINVK